MRIGLIIAVFVWGMMSGISRGDTLLAQPLITSLYFDERGIKKTLVKRVEAGLYNNIDTVLCRTDLSQCESPKFERYKNETGDVLEYTIRLEENTWSTLPPEVKEAYLLARINWDWGILPSSPISPNPLHVVYTDGEFRSPLERLSPESQSRYLQYAEKQERKGGVGVNAYGPNCWYNSIAAIADNRASYAQANDLRKARWEKARFMGPAEFRFLMETYFEEVEEPRFGDIVRYYTADNFYDEDLYIYSGEVHAAVYIGREQIKDGSGMTGHRDIVLTKNGRYDMNFLIFQDIARLDKIYLLGEGVSDPRLEKHEGIEPRGRGYFRVKEGVTILDPATAGSKSDAYPAYIVDRINYRDRLAILAGEIQLPADSEETAYSYPKYWLLDPSSHTQARLLQE